MMRLFGALALVALCLAASVAPARAQAPAVRVVSPQGPYRTVQAALADANPGDSLEVRSGLYHGPLHVDKPVQLRGVGMPVIDGGGKGTVVTLDADDIVFSGFEVRASGVEPDLDDSGIIITGARARVEGNHLHDVLFGVFISKAADAVLRDNDISSKPQYESGRKGDSVRIWYSPNALIEHNVIHDARDIVIWYSSNARVRDNRVEHGRFAVHLMYSNGTQIERNRLLNNSVGVFSMYSKELLIRDNLVRGQRGPSGSGLGFKDAEDVSVTGNIIVDNRIGIYLDGTPFSPSGTSHLADNIIAFNDIGAVLLPAVRGNVFDGNTFWENIEQVGIQGGGTLAPNQWRGNYWSDYAGFDADGDGSGESAYKSERFFDGMIDRQPTLRALLFSPVVQALEVAAATFPIVRPQPKLVDEHPRYAPAAVPPAALLSGAAPTPMLAVGLLLLGFGIMVGALAVPRFAGAAARTAQAGGVLTTQAASAQVLVCAQAIGKRYGRVRVLEGVSFEVRSGEALALWGANGAGKTTLIKAILGVIDFEGNLQLGGRDVKRDGKLARRGVGYVPQDAAFNDWNVRHTLEFYARLKHVHTRERIDSLLARMGLSEHARKTVGALSGGLKQRLALAIALLADPPLLLLDEPTSNLDKQARADYLAMLSALRAEGKTIIFTSHRFEEVESLADRVLVMEQGRIAESLTPEMLRARWMPEVELTLWISDAQRAQAIALLERAGLQAHLNGRGTVVCLVRPDQKMRPLEALSAQGIHVANFEIERGRPWS